jgi:protein-disulfide isomerase
LIHGPSLAIGASIASVLLIITFLGFDALSNQPELVLEPTPTVQQAGPPNITMNTFLANGSPILGDATAPVTLVEFGDYQCHFCNVFFHSTEEDILNNYVETGKVKMIFKDYNIIGPDSVNASHGAHCANDQGLFWEYHDILYSNWTGENNGWASSENLRKFAQEIGLDMDMWSECMLNGKHSQTILGSNDDARNLELTGTPAFFVIGPDGKTTQLFGAQPYETFEKVFENELAK